MPILRTVWPRADNSAGENLVSLMNMRFCRDDSSGVHYVYGSEKTLACPAMKKTDDLGARRRRDVDPSGQVERS